MTTECKLPPVGWKCTRGEHADGPCAAVPDLPPLDMHGVDDDDVYHPPSRARYEEMCKRLRDGERQVDELQAACSRIENERRKYRALHAATRAMLLAACIEIPIDLAVHAEGGEVRVSKLILDVHERNERLEADAWCGAANEVRSFIKEAEAMPLEAWSVSNVLSAFIAQWVKRFATVIQ